MIRTLSFFFLFCLYVTKEKARVNEYDGLIIIQSNFQSAVYSGSEAQTAIKWAVICFLSWTVKNKERKKQEQEACSRYRIETIDFSHCIAFCFVREFHKSQRNDDLENVAQYLNKYWTQLVAPDRFAPILLAA